ncbi:MAG: type II toxin-antitoxin system VapC family toxin [Bacteroidota bacterium]
MKYLLDSDTCISFLKDQFNIAEKIESVGIENCYVSEITIAELSYGAYNSMNFEKHIPEVKSIAGLYTVLSIYGSIDIYAKEKSRLRKEGNLIPDFDLLIGATAVAHDMIMVTSNVKHMRRIQFLKIENWREAVFNEFLK